MKYIIAARSERRYGRCAMSEIRQFPASQDLEIEQKIKQVALLLESFAIVALAALAALAAYAASA